MDHNGCKGENGTDENIEGKQIQEGSLPGEHRREGQVNTPKASN
jgi:hypothetical protein